MADVYQRAGDELRLLGSGDGDSPQMVRRVLALEERFDASGKVKAENLPLSDAVDSDSGTTAASDKAVKTAYDKGVSAESAAATAQSTADAAQGAASAAQGTADAAKTAAATAQSTADGAQATAVAAQSTADGAKAAADAAQGTATAAQGAASAAQGTANAAIPRDGARGALAGCQSAVALWGDQSITSTTTDAVTLTTSGGVNIYFTAAAADVSAVKTLTFTASGPSALVVHGAEWANRGTAPVWGNAGTALVLAAHFTGGRVVLHVLDNTQA